MTDILTKISNLPVEIQNKIFYYLSNEKANLIKNIDWKKEYMNTFYKINIKRHILESNIKYNVYGCKRFTLIIETYIKFERQMSNFYLPISCIYKNFNFSNYSKYYLRDLCHQNGIKKFNKNDKKKMIQLLMKI
jgi:hypothetical protein